MPSVIEQIATDLNVSSATVSRALNDRPGVSAALRERVLERARELDYTPNMMARGLVTSQTFTLGFFVREKPELSAQMHCLRDGQIADPGMDCSEALLHDAAD